MKKRVIASFVLSILAIALFFYLISFINKKMLVAANQVVDFIGKNSGVALKISKPLVSFFPLAARVEKIDFSYGGRTLAELSDCSFNDFSDFIFNKEQKINFGCRSGEVGGKDSLEFLKTLLYSKGEKKFFKENGGKRGDKRVAGKNFNLFVENLALNLENIKQNFAVDFELSGGSGKLRARAGENGSEKADDLLELLFSTNLDRFSLVFNKINSKYFREFLLKRSGIDLQSGILDGFFNITERKEDFEINGDFTVADLKFFHPLIDSKPFDLSFLRFEGSANLDLGQKSARIESSRLSLGGIEAILSMNYSPNLLKLSIKTESLNLNRLAALIRDKTFEGYLFDGSVDLVLNYSKEGKNPPLFSIGGKVENPRQLSDRLNYLRSQFDYAFVDSKGQKSVFKVGAQNRFFTPISLLPEHLIWAVIISEDAGFFIHKGVDFQELNAAVADNIKKHKLRGGSTITQQIAKNLFLTREKTLLRKFREVLLAIELDATLSKERLLEIYFNIVEWAPGVFGISRAADYYFDKTPLELTPLESAYLASIIPGPYKYHRQFLSGNVSDKWYEHLFRILDIMNEIGRLPFSEYLEAQKTPLVFRAKEN